MKRNIVLLGLVLAVVGCRNNDAQVPPPATGDAATPSTLAQLASAEPAQAAVANAVNCPAGSKTDNPLPALGLQVNVPCGLRSDRTYQTAAGVSRRQVTFEYLEVTPNDALNAARATLEADGFKAKEQPAPTAGTTDVIRMSLAKAGFGTIQVWANPNPKIKIRNPAAHGAIGIDFPAPNVQ